MVGSVTARLSHHKDVNVAPPALPCLALSSEILCACVIYVRSLSLVSLRSVRPEEKGFEDVAYVQDHLKGLVS